MIRTHIFVGSHPLTVAVPMGSAEMTQGLEGWAPLFEDEGMLFVFERTSIVAMRMGAVRFPIDLLFIVGDQVSAIATMHPGDGMVQGSARCVLEVYGGWCLRHGITEAAPVRVTS